MLFERFEIALAVVFIVKQNIFIGTFIPFNSEYDVSLCFALIKYITYITNYFIYLLFE